MTLHLMSDKELTRFDIINDLEQKRITQTQTSELLGVTTRQVQRIVFRYRSDGIPGLTSKKRDQRSNHAYPAQLRNDILTIIRENYHDFGPTLACEKLVENHQEYKLHHAHSH